MIDKMEKRPQAATSPPGQMRLRIVESRELLAGDKVVIIRHDTDDYQLRVTGAGKLILTK